MLLGTLNGLRLLAPIGVMDELVEDLDGVLDEGLNGLLEYGKEVGKKYGEETERVVKGVEEVYVGTFVPFMRRALIEGVYGVSYSSSLYPTHIT